MIVTCCGSTAAVLCQYASGAFGWKNNNFLLSELHFFHFYVKGCICIVFLSLRRHDVFNLAVWLLNSRGCCFRNSLRHLVCSEAEEGKEMGLHLQAFHENVKVYMCMPSKTCEYFRSLLTGNLDIIGPHICKVYFELSKKNHYKR